MWRLFGSWISPTAPDTDAEEGSLLLGVLAIALLVVSLPWLFGV